MFVAVGMKPNTNMVPDEIKKDEAEPLISFADSLPHAAHLFCGSDKLSCILLQETEMCIRDRAGALHTGQTSGAASPS